jgi:hypothetical protein
VLDSSLVAVNTHLLITRLQYVSRDLSGVQTLRTCQNSIFSPLISQPFIQPSINTSGHSVLCPFKWTTNALYPIRDTIITCVIVDWRQHDNAIEIIAVDTAFVTVVFHYTRPHELSGESRKLYPWLRKRNVIVISLCTIREYDCKHDIIMTARSDHTVVTADNCPEPIIQALCRNLARLSSDSDAEVIFEQESLRYAALRDGKSSYGNEGESCVRKRICPAQLRLIRSLDRDDQLEVYYFEVNGEFMVRLPWSPLLQTLLPSSPSPSSQINPLYFQWDILLKQIVNDAIDPRVHHEVIWINRVIFH